MKNFFEMLATEVVEDVRDADVIVTNKKISDKEIAEDAQIIREYDVEKMLALMN